MRVKKKHRRGRQNASVQSPGTLFALCETSALKERCGRLCDEMGT